MSKLLFAFGAYAKKKLSAPLKISSIPVQPVSTKSVDAKPFLAGIPPKTKAFSIWSLSLPQAAIPEDCWAV